jgi:hypothetical protein
VVPGADHLVLQCCGADLCDKLVQMLYSK